MSISVEAVYEDGVLKLDRPLDLAEKTRVHVRIESGAETPHTPLGSTLLALREQILAAGAIPLGWDEVSAEVASRRGGHEERR
jgi:predicted DNA-binding antitoxin AbrB/MazE fold protein